MKKFLAQSLCLFSLLFAFTPILQAAETYRIDPMHTFVLWHVSHFGFSIQSGKFTMLDGEIHLDTAKPFLSTVRVTIPTKEVYSGIEKLDEHLRSADFLDVANYPTATFVSNKIVVTGHHMGKIYGNLTLHGVTRPVILNVKLLKQGINPMKNKQSLGFHATTTIKRSDFGISAHVPNVGDEVKLDIGVEANLVD